MSMLNPNQKQTANQFQNKSKEEQANEIARICNEKGITKEQLQSIVNMFNNKGLKWEIILNKFKERRIKWKCKIQD